MIELCRHIKPEGTACKGPAVRGTNFCRHHQLIKSTLDKVKPSIENNGVYKPLPFLFPEDRSAIQTNVFLVINAFNRRRIDAKAAKVMLYGFQVCLSNLNKGPLTQTDADNAVQRVILTPEGDEIAPPHEKLEKDESPIHYKDCPCQRCAEQFRGAAPEQHHADCKCGLCEPIDHSEAQLSTQECHPERSEEPVLNLGAPHLEEMWDGAKRENHTSESSHQNETQISTNECHPEAERSAAEESVLSEAKEPAFVFGCHPERSATIGERVVEGPAFREARAGRLLSADQLDPIQKAPDYDNFIYGDEIAKHEAQHAARVRAALEAGLEPPEHTPWDTSIKAAEAERKRQEWKAGIDQRRKEAIDKWNAEHPEDQKEFKPFLTWGEEHDLKLAEMKKLREQDEARAREQSASAS